MPVFYPLAGSIWLAGVARTALANSKLKLFQSSLVPNVNTTKAELDAAEADFSGYAEITLTAWGVPYTVAAGGAAINSPCGQFDTDDPTTVTNNIGGAWVETSGGVLVIIDSFPDVIPMNAPNQSIPIQEILRFLSGL
jgi:hypothetical protein